MRERYAFPFDYCLLVIGCCLWLSQITAGAATIAVEALTLTCALGGCLLLGLSNRTRWLPLAWLAVAAGALLAFGAWMLPLAAVLVVQAVERFGERRAQLALTGVALALLAFLLEPPIEAILIALLCAVPLLFIAELFDRLDRCHALLADRAEENDGLRERLTTQRRMVQSMEHATRIQERNRLAASIHDQIGHGVSSSILLLEGAMLNLEKNPVAAHTAVRTATENLRASVDDIRAALRRERATQGEAGLAEMAAQLHRFSADHPGIDATLATDGDMSQVSPFIWRCLTENLTEALTNLLKHSNATRFAVHISAKDKLVTARFVDDGAATGYTPGMGLRIMEERCALCNGRCFITATKAGFSIVMTFTAPGAMRDKGGMDA